MNPLPSEQRDDVKSVLEAFGEGLDTCERLLSGLELTYEQAHRFSFAFNHFYLTNVAPRIKP